MTDLTERLLTRLRELNTTDDHARGCQGREYHCSCDYDIRVENAVFEAATTLEALTQENARLREALEGIKAEAERENGGWVHLKRAIAVGARKALGGGDDAN